MIGIDDLYRALEGADHPDEDDVPLAARRQWGPVEILLMTVLALAGLVGLAALLWVF